jgi:acetylornithine deacetylase/succinyl-diaminopimelate desuccinylase-like protein
MHALTEIEKFLIDLVNVESTSGNEIAIAEFIESRLNGWGGFRLERQYIDENRFNVIARKGKSKTWIVAHMDTVPPFFPARVTADKIFGRGTTDNKGNLAGAIFAAHKLKDINILFTVGEEQDFIGARKAKVEGSVVVLEPTNFKVRTSQCGVIAARLTAIGDQKHSSLLGAWNENALHVLVEVLHGLMARKWHHFNIGTMRGGTAANVVAGSAEVEFSVRPRSQREFSEILKTLRAIKNVRVQIINSMPPFISRIAQNYAQSDPVPFFSELAFFKNGLIFGAGDIAQAHAPMECLHRKDLQRLPAELALIVKSLEDD